MSKRLINTLTELDRNFKDSMQCLYMFDSKPHKHIHEPFHNHVFILCHNFCLYLDRLVFRPTLFHSIYCDLICLIMVESLQQNFQTQGHHQKHSVKLEVTFFVMFSDRLRTELLSRIETCETETEPEPEQVYQG